METSKWARRNQELVKHQLVQLEDQISMLVKRNVENIVALLNIQVNQLAAFYRGRNVVLTIENPNKNETNKRFIRVNARDVWSGGGKEKKR